jgi:hypothetical protein
LENATRLDSWRRYVARRAFASQPHQEGPIPHDALHSQCTILPQPTRRRVFRRRLARRLLLPQAGAQRLKLKPKLLFGRRALLALGLLALLLCLPLYCHTNAAQWAMYLNERYSSLAY